MRRALAALGACFFGAVMTILGTAAAQTPDGWTDRSSGDTGRYVAPDGVLIVLVEEIEGTDPAEILNAHIARHLTNATVSPIETSALGNVRVAKATVADAELEGSKGVYVLNAMARPGKPVRLVTVMPQEGIAGRTDYQAGLAALISGVPDAAARGAATAGDDGKTGGAASVKGVVHAFGKKKYNTFSGTWKFGEEAIWLVYDDGWAMKNPGLPLSPAEAAASRRADPDAWVRVADEPRLGKKAKLMRPLERGTRLSLAVGRPTTDGAPGVSSVTRRGLTLTEDGRFQTTFSALVSGGWESGERVADRSETATGTYEVDGAVIILRFEDGSVSRQLFATDGDGGVVFGDRYYFD